MKETRQCKYRMLSYVCARDTWRRTTAGLGSGNPSHGAISIDLFLERLFGPASTGLDAEFHRRIAGAETWFGDSTAAAAVVAKPGATVALITNSHDRCII